MKWRMMTVVLGVAALLAPGHGPAAQEAKEVLERVSPPTAAKVDRHAGYYYPEPSSTHVYKARSRTLPDMDRRRRVGFVVAMVNQSLAMPYPPTYSVFAKGDDARKLIIVSNEPGRLNTVYRARALLATLTSVARNTPIFREFSVEDWFTFLDLAKMLGFKQVTVSDGESFTHQVIVK